MLQKIKSLVEKRLRVNKVLVRLIIRRLAQDEIYELQRLTYTWKIPGKISTLPGAVVCIELEGAQSILNARIADLKSLPRIGLRPMEIKWRPYSGQYKHFNVVFA